MNKTISLTVILAAGVLSVPASADIILPSAVMTVVANGADFDYTITLENSSASLGGIGTFWYAWLPGKDFLATRPIEIFTPAGWKSKITGGNPGDGFAIQWVALTTADDILPGHSLEFGFRSADPPAVLAGNSPFHTDTPIDTSVVFPAGPFSDPGHTFVVRAVPEPSSLMLAAGGFATWATARLRRRKFSKAPTGTGDDGRGV